MIQTFNAGDKVTYHGPGGTENGIVKRMADDGSYFVVYHCAGRWLHYEEYTASKTPSDKLTEGWGL